MGGVRSDLAVLGLEPGADRRAIDDAFRRLMKLHHPDRPGGDSARAAEIIRAYRALRPGAMAATDIELRIRPRRPARRWPWWVAAALAAAASIILLMLYGQSPPTGPARIGAEVVEGLGLRLPKPPNLIERPLHDESIDSATDDARAMVGGSDEMELAEKSRACHFEFRDSRDLAAFDRCVAFDMAVVLLQDRDPLRDQGPFRQVAVNRRHWSDAALLSSDSLAIDSRLDRIRLRVELRLAPPEPEPPRPEPDPAPEVPNPSG
jgi:hypothetical protein